MMPVIQVPAWAGNRIMAGISPKRAGEEQTAALHALACSRERGEADQACAVLLTLAGWTSGRIVEQHAST